MSIEEIFAHLSGPRANEAMTALLGKLRDAADKICGSCDPADHEDVVQRAGIYFLERERAGEDRPRSFTFLKNKVRWLWLDHVRRTGLQRELDDRTISGWVLVAPDADSHALAELVVLVIDRAVADRLQHHRDGVREAIELDFAIATGRTAPDALLAQEGWTPDDGKRKRKLIQDRIANRFRNARKYIGAAIDHLAAEGEIGEEERRALRTFLAAVPRRRTASPATDPAVNLSTFSIIQAPLPATMTAAR